ncbi:hypothetical protein ACFQPA_03265 [Halomarina halobia]|uniref:GGDEF domain-containing protein n=1 Tax=Halomarina halobia TaxID=3033386 RepID=A0ABD6A526_9EURY|nr:hypothetical protein [Halomarina sp. PSR21]
MVGWLDVARVASAVNVGLLLSFGYVWGRNHLELRTRQTLGLLVFACCLLAANLLALYYVTAAASLQPSAIRAVAALQLLQAVGLLALAWVTWN